MKYSILIFSFLYHVSFACDVVVKNCTKYLMCYDNTIDLYFDIVFNIDIDDGCYNVKYIRNSDQNLIPIRLLVTYPQIEHNLPYLRHDNYEYQRLLHIITFLDLAETSLNDTPTFAEMTKLETLNLSNNVLHEAKLFNKFELVTLENIDLSHNIINTIKVNDSQYVYKNLHKLNLAHNYLTNISEGIFILFRNLEYLDLTDNYIATVDQNSYEGLMNLKYLSLSENRISDINLSLFRFIYLEELHFEKNKIEKVSAQDFEKLSHLKSLDLSFNKICRIDKVTFSRMDSLTVIKLNHNLLSSIDEETFLTTPNLKTINLSNNILKNLPKDLFRNKNISSFSIAKNSLEGAISRGIFEGLQLITELDISFQEISAVEDYTFFGLEELRTLLLNDNKIRTISKYSFKTLKHLNQLDLSNNLILNIDFDKHDLYSVESLYLRNNFIYTIRHDDFNDLNIRFLDLSNNNISQLEPYSFKSVKAMESFHIFHNPLSGPLLNNTFEGLPLLPVLDLSFTSLTAVHNGSFNGMIRLQDLNISHSSISVLEFNAFMNTGNLKLIDLSYNELSDFFVNIDDLKNVTALFLNNNYLVCVAEYFFKEMKFLTKVILSNNYIFSVDERAFVDQSDLRYLDLSFNSNLTFYISTIDNAKNLETLLLSDVKSGVDFSKIGDNFVKKLVITDSRSIVNVSLLHLNSMTHLTDLDMSNNSIIKLELSTFKDMTSLNWLDVSFNKISFIQPSTFKDNIFLYQLNLSHNCLTNLNYGIFRGLASLHTLDVSNNNIQELQRALFYDIENLKVLIVDNNQITDIKDDFFVVKLDLLSIGGNLLACERIAYMKYREHINVGTINKDETNNFNIDGITCDKNKYDKKEIKFDENKFKNNNILENGLKEILLNLSTAIRGLERSKNINSDQLNQIDKFSADQASMQFTLKNFTSGIANQAERSNIFLERILKAIVGLGTQRPVIVSANNATDNKYNSSSIANNAKLDNLVLDVSQVKQEVLYLENMISEMDRKIATEKFARMESESTNKSDILVRGNIERSSIFVDVCVSLILIILLCFIIYKFYVTKILRPNPRSVSTRNINDSMDNTHL